MMRSSKLLYYAVFIPVMFWAVACEDAITNKEQIRKYLSEEDNGLIKLVKVGAVSSSLSYCPVQLLSVSGESIALNTYSDGRIYFLWSLSSDNQSLLSKLNRENYSNITRLLSFNISSLIDVNIDGNPLEILDSSFSPMYGLASGDDILIVLDRKEVLTGRQLRIAVEEFGLGTGSQQFIFDTADILKLEKQLKSYKV